MSNRRAKAGYDYQTLLLVFCLLGFGIVMLYSSSADLAAELYDDHTYFLKRQLVRIFLGLGSLFFFSQLNYKRLKQPALVMMLIAILLLIITHLAHILSGGGGTARWLDLGVVSIQSSDVVRLALIVYLAAYIDRKYDDLQDFRYGVLPPLVLLFLAMVLIIFQPDFSSAILLALTGITLLFLGGIRGAHLATVGISAMPFLILLMLAAPYRIERLKTYLGLNPGEGSGYQISQALISLGHGGILGRGLGNSIEKKLFLPAPHTDFVLAIIGEELGFVGAILVLAVFIWLFQRAIVIARNAPDRFGLFLALGIALNLIIYVLINASVVAQLAPNTGIPLPFVSYGGSHLIFTLTSMGILLNISKASRRQPWSRTLGYGRVW